MTTTGAERAAALDSALAVLACPLCGAALSRADGGLACARGHHHDVARQGYAALAAGSPAHGDTAPMVAARAAFLATGHFAAVEEEVVASVPPGSGWCADLAGGPGHHLTRVLDARPELAGVALDLSAAAARAAAGAHLRIASATADVWRRLPLADGAVRHALDVFGPRNGREFARVLAPGGALTVVTPLPGHLAELREPFGTLAVDAGKARRTAEALRPLRQEGRRDVVDRRTLPPGDVARAVLMGPNGHHLDADAVRATADRLGETVVTIAVSVAVWRA